MGKGVCFVSKQHARHVDIREQERAGARGMRMMSGVYIDRPFCHPVFKFNSQQFSSSVPTSDIPQYSLNPSLSSIGNSRAFFKSIQEPSFQLTPTSDLPPVKIPALPVHPYIISPHRFSPGKADPAAMLQGGGKKKDCAHAPPKRNVEKNQHIERLRWRPKIMPRLLRTQPSSLAWTSVPVTGSRRGVIVGRFSNYPNSPPI
jgi:hypothetical protein